MDRITSLRQIQELMTLVRNKRKGFLTNFYLQEFRHNIWIEKQALYYEWIKTTCFLFRKAETYWNVFFITSTSEELCNALFVLKEKYGHHSLIFDVVGKMEQCQELLPIFHSNGFIEETSLVRFIRINTLVEYDEEIASVQKASSEQTKEVYDMLNQYMNARNEQIPYLEEYEEWGRLGHILVYIVGGQIAGFFDYEKNSSTMIPRHWLVHPDYRGKRIGSILYKRLLFEACETKRILSWVIRTNKISIQTHLHYGFKEENLYDFVLANK